MTIQSTTLTDPQGLATARVLVGYGFNCYQWCVQSGGKPIEVLWSEAEFSAGRARASGSGIPVLFPFPGRIPGVVFRWEDRDYRLEEGDGRGNAIHGFVLNRPWRVIEQKPHCITGEFQGSVDDPQLLGRWPGDFRIQMSYELDGRCLRSRIVVQNPGDRPLPCGLGTHPYFRLPLGGSAADACVIQLPFRRRWELVDMLPTGRCTDLPDAERFRAGLPYKDVVLDAVFGGLEFVGDWCTATIRDPAAGSCLSLRFDRTFCECVVYTPPHRQAICIEPYTCVAGGFELHRQGKDMGIRVLEPGESFAARVEMQLDSLP